MQHDSKNKHREAKFSRLSMNMLCFWISLITIVLLDSQQFPVRTRHFNMRINPACCPWDRLCFASSLLGNMLNVNRFLFESYTTMQVYLAFWIEIIDCISMKELCWWSACVSVNIQNWSRRQYLSTDIRDSQFITLFAVHHICRTSRVCNDIIMGYTVSMNLRVQVIP